MKFKEKLQDKLKGKIPSSLLSSLPSGYSIIGDIAILRHLNPALKNYKKVIGESLISLDPQVNTVLEQSDTISSYRKPVTEFIAGDERTTTLHREFNTVFHIDLSKITFSPGNKNERNHLIQIVEKNDVICDMFACIGNLSLPIAVNVPSTRVYAVEWNLTAYEFLVQNIKANKVSNRYFPIHGDNRQNTPKNIASKVLMGYFQSDYNQLQSALQAIKKQGWIFLHNIQPRDITERPMNIIEQVKNKTGYVIEVKETRLIKKFSPRLNHICYDIFVKKV